MQSHLAERDKAVNLHQNQLNFNNKRDMYLNGINKLHSMYMMQ
jgi:hypothetical protein